MKKYGTWIALALFAAQIGLLIGWDAIVFYNMGTLLFYLMMVILFVLSALTAFYYGYLRGWKISGAVPVAVSAVICPGLTLLLPYFLCNAVFDLSRTKIILIVTVLTTAYLLSCFIVVAVKVADKNVLRKCIAGVVAAVFTAGIIIPIVGYLQFNYKAPSVTGLGTYVRAAYPKQDNADVYVSTKDGDDILGNGTIEKPYKTIDRAKQAVRDIDRTDKNAITVAIKAGEYRVDTLCYEEADGGTQDCPVTYCAYGDGEVVINGGATLDPKDFTKITDVDMKNRLSEKARDKVVCLDLSTYDITKDDYGKICAIGSYNTADKYDGEYVGPIYSELFFNDTRMSLARYPDEGFLKTGTVVEMGKGLESDGNATADPVYWATAHNPKGDTYALSSALTKRISSWKTLDDVWMFGFWKWTWADASTPIGEFNKDKKTITTKFVSRYGAIKDAPYYFFNVFEELDAPGEWYLDRQSGILYMYPLENMATSTIDISLTKKPVLQVNANYLTFKNLTIKGTRGNGMVIHGNNDVVTLCRVKNVGENALLMTGDNNLASENDISHTGKGGIILDGGDLKTLTRGESKAYNNLIHDFSEIYLTYQPAVSLHGVGNYCSHNEIYGSPHEAVTYFGNYLVVEYNNIHDVCLLSDDAGAIYAGRSWEYYGNVVRYNAVYNLGSGNHHPCGIYMDDALAGQTVYGNILVNVPDVALELGGGRDLVIQNNLIINTGSRAIAYDNRARNSALQGYDESIRADGELWNGLDKALKEAPILKDAFPQIDAFVYDFSAIDDPNFIPNPANSVVTKNVIVGIVTMFESIHPDARRFSTIENNPTYSLLEASSLFVDYARGDYRLKPDSDVFKDLPDFEPIPVSEIGRCASTANNN